MLQKVFKAAAVKKALILVYKKKFIVASTNECFMESTKMYQSEKKEIFSIEILKLTYYV